MPNITLLPPKTPPVSLSSLLHIVDGATDFKVTLANLFTALGYSTDVNAFLASISSRAGFDSLSKKGADVASAATVDLDTVTGNYVNITGTTTITAITLAEGKQRLVRFAGALTLTHGASLVLPDATNITTAAGDFALFVGDTGGVDRCAGYFRANTQATETAEGVAKIATQAETDAGTDNARFVTPLKLRFGFAASFTTTGYIAFPSWLGGWIVQWGTGVSTAGTLTQTYPIPFPNAVFAKFANGIEGAFQTSTRYVSVRTTASTTQILVDVVGGGIGIVLGLNWLAIGK